MFAAYLFPYAGYTEESVTSTLDALAEDVAQCVLVKHLKEVDKLADLGNPPYLPRVKVFVDDQIKICEAINEVLYTVHGFRGNSEDYYNINNSLIHEVSVKDDCEGLRHSYMAKLFYCLSLSLNSLSCLAAGTVVLFPAV